MINDQAAVNYAQRILNSRRIRYRELTAKKIEEVYNAVPELRDLDSELSSLSAQNIINRLNGRPEVSLDDLEAKRVALLEAAGYDDSAFEEQHFCPLCRDTGYVNGEPCECYRSLLSDFEQEELNKVSPLALSRFEDFSLSYYPETSRENPKISPRRLMEFNYEICVDYAEDFPSRDNLMMTGSAGLGKTHLALSIANRVIERGYEVFYCSAASIFNTLEDEKYGRKTGTTLSNLKNCDLLVLDDLGAEHLTSSIVSSLYDLINSRINAEKPTIITTNITENADFSRRYPEKIASRLLYCFKILPFIGDDIRKLKS
ncbi:MAG: ATP-binding protein [Oscillospiraceae bacterium]|nr:ATP-binding protein [Oscillospiraceae bacterium]